MQAHTPSERTFGTSVGLAFAGLGALLAWRGASAIGPSLAALGVLLVVLGRAAPSALRVPNRYWWRFAQTLGWINTRVLLTAFYALVLTPVGLVMRLAGRNPLRPAKADSGWAPYPPRRRDPKHYERMF